jgi:hypothetical protein
MHAIQVKLIAPTNTRGARFKAIDGEGNSITVPFDYALNSGANHIEAARALAEKMKWAGEWVQGFIGGVSVYVRVTGSSGARLADSFTIAKGE